MVSLVVTCVFDLPFGFARRDVHRGTKMRHIHRKNVNPHLQLTLRKIYENFTNHFTTQMYSIIQTEHIYLVQSWFVLEVQGASFNVLWDKFTPHI